MWRRVLSQSPSKVPTDAASAKQADHYLEAWAALGTLLHSGRSLSGHERNCCFLNTGATRFADASAATGLDHDADSRAFASIDWDGDGDLDLWFANRTRPRVRYLQNDSPAANRYLALKLRGVTCNRDAIGARVTVQLGGPHKPLVRTLTAGDGFLSQSTKWLHFGLGAASVIQRVDVQWPGGKTESFSGFQPNGRYVITQGESQAVVWRQTTPAAVLATVAPPAESLPTGRIEETQRIVLPQRLPLPDIAYRRLDGSTQVATQPGSPRLINLWASWCQPCVAELSAWKQSAAELQQLGLSVIVLNVDHAEAEIAQRQLDEVRELFTRLDVPFECGLIDRANAELIEIVQQALWLRQHALPIPTSLLLDHQGRLSVMYEGPVSIAHIIADVTDLTSELPDPRDRAVPFPGRWLTAPFPPDLFAIPDRLLAAQRGNDAYHYLKSHVLSQTANRRETPDAWRDYGVKANKVVDTLNETARLVLADGNPDGAIELLEHATQYAPRDWELHGRLVRLLISQKRSADAIRVSQRMAQLQPKHPLPWNNIAWVLATSDLATVRDPKRAIELAEDICRRTNHQEPTALDTLAVAYAADGRFDDAVRVAQQAIAQCQELKLESLSNPIQERLRLFQNQQPFRP